MKTHTSREIRTQIANRMRLEVEIGLQMVEFGLTRAIDQPQCRYQHKSLAMLAKFLKHGAPVQLNNKSF